MVVNQNPLVHDAAAGLKLGAGFRSRYDTKRLTLLTPRIARTLPNPPTSIRVKRQQEIDQITWGVMRNDVLGDCTVAGKWHLVQANSTLEGRPFVQIDALVEQEYMALTGGVDSGLALLDVLNPWQKDTGPHSIAAFAEIPWTDPGLSAAQSRKLLKTGIYLFGGSYTAVELPTGLQRTPFDWRTVGTGIDWRVGSWGGHCVPILLYVSASGRLEFYVVTWGRLVPVSEAFLRRYMVEAWVVVSRDYQNAKGLTPTGRTQLAMVLAAQALAA